MTTFSAADAALSGFRYIGRRPWVVLAWAGVVLGYEVIYGGLLALLAGDKQAAIATLSEVNRSDPEAALAMLPSVSFVFLFTALAALALSSVMFTAAYRAFLRPQDSRFAYLRFGRDELRMAVLIVATAALDAGGLFLIAFVTGSLAGLGAALPNIVQMLYFPILAIGAICAMTWPVIRLSLAMPMTLADRHFRLFESWKPTHGHFWKLLSAYLLSAILMLVLLLTEWAIVAVIAAIVMVVSHLPREAFSGLFHADASSLKSYFSVTTVIGLVLNALAFAASLAILISPVTDAYNAFVIHAEPPHAPEPELPQDALAFVAAEAPPSQDHAVDVVAPVATPPPDEGPHQGHAAPAAPPQAHDPSTPDDEAH